MLTSKTGKWLFDSFDELVAAVNQSRDDAAVDADDGTFKFIRERTVRPMISTISNKGFICEPCLVASAIEWEGFPSKEGAEEQLQKLLNKIENEYPDVETICIFGGFDGADLEEDFERGAYDTWIANYEVCVWKKNQ